MARCGCAQDCLCVLVDGECTTVVGSGAVAAPYAINVEIDPDAGNQLECGDDGLLVPAGPTELPITVLDTPCMDLSGDGTVADPLTATPVISPEPDNQLSCEPGPAPAAGLYVPPPTVGGIAIYGAMDLSASPFVTPGGAPLVTLLPWPYDRVVYDVGGIVDIGSSLFRIPAGGNGWYHIEAHWQDNTVANNFQAGLFGGFFQQRYGMVITTGGTPFPVPTPIPTQDRLVEATHAFHVSHTRFLMAGDTVEFIWEVINTTGAAVGPMAFNPVPLPVSENWAKIEQVGK